MKTKKRKEGREGGRKMLQTRVSDIFHSLLAPNTLRT